MERNIAMTNVYNGSHLIFFDIITEYGFEDCKIKFICSFEKHVSDLFRWYTCNIYTIAIESKCASLHDIAFNYIVDFFCGNDDDKGYFKYPKHISDEQEKTIKKYARFIDEHTRPDFQHMIISGWMI